MKENSPIGIVITPIEVADKSDSFVRSAANVVQILFITTAKKEKTKIKKAFFTKTEGFIIIPIEIKKIATKRSLIGRICFIIRFDSVVSDKSIPATNAPRAGDNPTLAENIEIERQKARDSIKLISFRSR